jgi:RNA polymerase sigma-70 factor (ECF subfamily)
MQRVTAVQFDVDANELEAFLAARKDALEQHRGELLLAFACARRDPRALKLFEERYLTQVGHWIARLRGEPWFVDEVRARLRERVLIGTQGQPPKILDSSGKGPLSAWARVTALREGLDLIQREKSSLAKPLDPERTSAADPDGDLMGAAIDPELHAIRERHLPQFQQAFRGALATLDARERNLLRFHFVEGLNIGRIGEIFGKSRATVGRMVLACRQKLLEETRRRLGDLTGASTGDVRSLIRLLKSQVDFGLSSFLRDQ